MTSAREAACFGLAASLRREAAHRTRRYPDASMPPQPCSISIAAADRSPSSARRASQRVQRASRKLPCSSRHVADPARRCSESTFCVASVKSGARVRGRASATCPRWVAALRCADFRSLYHVQTSTGSRAKPSGEASSSTRCVRQSPPTPRNVGRPLSAEMPEPVSTKTDDARAQRFNEPFARVGSRRMRPERRGARASLPRLRR